MVDRFVHLHNHTEFSFLDGFSKVWNTGAKEPGTLIKRLMEIGQESCAITDHGSTAGWIRFDKSCNKNGIKPVFGVEGYYCDNRHIKGLSEEEKLKAVRGVSGVKERKAAVRKREAELGLSKRSHFVALAMNEKGLYEINRTLTLASTEGFHFRPRWDWELMQTMNNCIITSGCAGGIINYHLKVDDFENRDEDKAWEEAKKWKKEFGDKFYIELMAIDWVKQELVDKVSYKIAKDLSIPIIITNDNHYVYPEDYETHDIMLALQSVHWKDLDTKDVLNDPKRMRYDMQDLYVKTRSEMFSSFRKHHKYIPKEEVSEMLDRTLEVAERCHHTVNKKKMIMPNIEVPKVKNLSEKYKDWSDIERYFMYLIFKGWNKKIVPFISEDKLLVYKKQLHYEIEQIKKLGFTPYFILTNRLMKWVDEQGIVRGPARGSSAGSLVAYLLDITMIDPIPHKLLFSRFIDPNRTDFPDVDMDFEDIRRREVVQYFIDTYGRDKVGILGNNTTMKAKIALKDVARLFKYEYPNMTNFEIQDICNLIVMRSGADSRLSFCLEDTFAQHEFAAEFKRKYPKVVRFAQELEGLTKCVTGDTLVKCKKGSELEIKYLYEHKRWKIGRGLKIRVFTGRWFEYRKVKEIYYNGVKSVYKLKADIYQIKCTNKHRFYTKNGWKRLEDLSIGEEIACNGLFCKGVSPWNKGLKGFQEAWNKGLSKETSESVAKQAKKMLGNKNGSYNSYKYKGIIGKAKWDWRKRVFENLPNICNNCGSKKRLQAHHKVPKCRNGSHTLDNAEILCSKCHVMAHRKLGTHKKPPDWINHKRICIKWVKVDSIKYFGKEKVYDIEINTDKKLERNYVANGILVHNSAGVHAAGVVISDVDINTYTALRRDKRNPDFLVTFMDKHDAEDIGILKMDVLGLNTMGIFAECLKLIEENHNKKINIEDICRDVSYNGGDKEVYKEFAMAHTEGVFQFMSPGLTRLAKQIHIDNFGEIADAVGLHRPGAIHSGAMNNYPAFKFGKIKEKERELHPIISKHTKDTYGLIIYQEQVMMIVRELGDFNWEQTNTVRKVMSKSGGAEYFMKTFWPQWKKGCMEKGMDEKTALKAFHKIMSFGCLSGDTLIENPYPNQNAKKWVKIEDLYKWDGYASPLAKGSKKQAYVKMQSYSYTKGRLRPNRIAKVFCNGKKELFEIITESGKKIKASAEHRFIIFKVNKKVFVKVKNIVIDDLIATDGGYSKTNYCLTELGKGWRKGRTGGAGDIKNGSSKEVNDFKNIMNNKPCEICKRNCDMSERFEVHHINHQPPNSKLLWLCNSCHKFVEYRRTGLIRDNRSRVHQKGHIVNWEKIISIKSIGMQIVYDLEMEDRDRPTYIANGFVSHNSWAMNLSHSVSYAMVSYICMWFKVHYPLEFVTAYLNRVTDSTGEKIPAMIREAQRLGIPIKEPDVNFSKEKFVIKDNSIIAGLSDIKHVGNNAVLEIVKNQPYKGLYSFVRKNSGRAVNKRTIENLIKAGAFDNFGYNKKMLLDNIEKINKLMKNKSDKKKEEAKQIISSCKGSEKYTEQEEAELKNSVSPITVGKHIVEYYSDVTSKLAKHIKLTTLAEIELDEGKQQESDRKLIKRKEMFVIGQLTKVDLKRLSQEVKEIIDTSKEKRYALANFVDGTDFIVLSFKNYIYERYEQKLFSWVNKVLLIQAECNVGWKKLYINKVWELDELRAYFNSNRKPYEFYKDYLFEHPLHRLFKNRLEDIRKKFEAKPLISVMKNRKNPSVWVIGIISDIQIHIIRKDKYKGQKMYIVYFEDETYKASFMVYPSDNRYPILSEMVLKNYEQKRPFLLYCQRDYKIKPEDSDFKHITLSIDKRLKWKDVYKSPFVFKGENNV